MIADDLLRYEEDAYLMEYEIGLDMYQRVYDSQFAEEKTIKEKVSKGLALYEFQGEFWNDELETYEVKLRINAKTWKNGTYFSNEQKPERKINNDEAYFLRILHPLYSDRVKPLC
jgi:hypothetical protein